MSTRPKLSKERSSSSKRSSTGSTSSYDVSRRNKLPDWMFKEMQSVIKKQERDLIVYSVREELMSRVMNECYKRYIEQQTFKFMAQCSTRAFVELLNLSNFNHDPGNPTT
ncbi:hypothetical protein FQR65_LT02089 [Abscondita terminalis]|nr:hypothetical protein FQR65_LT02089 [Abscondita terminalis]